MSHNVQKYGMLRTCNIEAQMSDEATAIVFSFS